MADNSPAAMLLTPIGVIHSPYRETKGTPIQPALAQNSEGFVEVFPAYRPGLLDLEGFERVWLLFWCHRASPFKLLVTPYLDDRQHGLFATRAPSRPNPIGISPVHLVRLEESGLQVAGLDILDGTPLLDIKPYVTQFDSYQVERCGWLDNRSTSRNLADSRFEQGKHRP
jgi:tRNA-Thr(GGU) m(6)t(6)A37 methyltransferase TsaA